MNAHTLDRLIHNALKEDAYDRDITSRALLSPKTVSKGYIIVKENAVICGLNIAKKVFKKVGRHIVFRSRLKDGTRVKKNARIATINGPTKDLLAGERTALNFLSHCSGIATTTYRFVLKAGKVKVKVLDTRKTTPGLRELEKYAVRCGRGSNHRMDLSGHAMIKDNHRSACAMTIARAVQKVRKKTRKTVEVEVDNLRQFHQALAAWPDIILLDNMSCSQMKKAVAANKELPKSKRPLLEASGGVTLDNIAAVARTGVDRISIGAITQSRSPVNFSMELMQ